MEVETILALVWSSGNGDNIGAENIILRLWLRHSAVSYTRLHGLGMISGSEVTGVAKMSMPNTLSYFEILD